MYSTVEVSWMIWVLRTRLYLTFTLCFFYKNTLYKNIEAQIVPKNKNKLRTSWSSDQDLLKIRTHQVDIRMY